VVYALDIPTSPAGVPWDHAFKWSAFNYSPLVLLVGVLVAIWWQVSAKNKYNGPVRTIDEPEPGPSVEQPPVVRPPETGPPPVGPAPTPAG
jgi:hypothetical protein